MKIIDRIEVARRLLVNAVNMNMSKDILLKISEKLDKYLVEYYKENTGGSKTFDKEI
ncbi:MAG: Spo0E family sporulation regulatory protein-aspartic acid phosphatase [Clostridia bacterium]|uniref:aspartyl-phosphate phosphatase Spo0E family protein n=1 Tax=Desulfitibacter alkalitolerans TaxID=264641 RepID=UPI0012EB6EA1|nr:aspartyl-phosphate phosphatase Spo0E family protein [Desulfitibacter alkalitolerans]MBS3968783.1 Spo0E family sporulation regulatory protein-aspartic acid phosphatase [Clostridia bacterium]